MENNMETVKTVNTDDFKHNLIKIAVATVASVIAKKLAEVAVERIFDRNQTVAIETTN